VTAWLTAISTYLYVIAPLVSGAFFSFVGLARQYPTTLKYVFKAWWATIFYLLLSSGGALVVTLVMRKVGTQVVDIVLLNDVLMGILGAGSFLGIISKVTISKSVDKELGSQLKTLRDYVYEFLEGKISRQVMQIVESKIRTVTQRPIDKDRFLKEANRLLGGTKLSQDQKGKMRIQFDEWVHKEGDYGSVIRELIKDYEVDYVIRELAERIPEEEKS